MSNVTFIIKLRDQLTKTAQKMQGQLNRVTAAAEQTANAVDNIGLIAGGAAIAGVFKMGAELEKTTLFFNTLTGSVEKGTKLFDELTQFANTTPFSNTAINKNAQTLLAFGQEAETVIDTLRMLGDVSGGDQERLSSLALAFAQAQSAGKLMGQDLLQFINAGFNPLNEIAKMTGKSMGVLKDEMSKGLITFDLVQKAFENATGPGGKFHDLTNSMADTMAGKWSTALGKAQFLVAEFGLAMKDIFTPFLDGIISAVEWISKYRKVFFPILKTVTIFTGLVIGLVGALKLWVAVQKVLNFLLTANPIGVIIVGIAALTAGIIMLYSESETFRRVVDGLWRSLKAIYTVVKASLMPSIIALSNVVSRLFGQFGRLFGSLKAGEKTVINFAFIIEKYLTALLTNALTPLIAIVTHVTDFLDIISKIGTVAKAVFVGDFAAAKVGLMDLGKAIGDFLTKRVKLFLKGFEHLGKAVKELFAGNFEEAIDQAFVGAKQIAFSPFGVDVNDVAQTAKKAAKAAIDAYKQVADGEGISIPGFDAGILAGGGLPSIGVGADVKKLQAEGVVSGGIKTFNININSLTGVNTLTTESMQDGARKTGLAFRDELLKVLADLKQV